MKVGDLVKLSSYGQKVKSNSRFIGPNDLGMVTEISSADNPDFPFRVDWLGLERKEKMCHSRQDLKYAK